MWVLPGNVPHPYTAVLSLNNQLPKSKSFTGFGILGHAQNLAKNQKNAVSFVIHNLPIIAKMPIVAKVSKVNKVCVGNIAQMSKVNKVSDCST